MRPFILSLLMILAIATLGAPTACESDDVIKPEDPRLVGMPGVTKKEAAELLQQITEAPFEIEGIGSHRGPTLREPIAISDLSEICGVFAAEEWRISPGDEQVYDAIKSNPDLAETYAILSYYQIYNPTPPSSFREFVDWLAEQIGSVSDPSETEYELMGIGVTERLRQTLYHICDLIGSK